MLSVDAALLTAAVGADGVSFHSHFPRGSSSSHERYKLFCFRATLAYLFHPPTQY